MRRPLALMAVAVSATYALWRMASRFPLPQHDISRWLTDVGPADASMSLLRLVALGAAIYLGVIGLLHVVVPTWSRAGRMVARFTLPSLRALLVTTALATSSAGAAFAGASALPPPPVSITLSEFAVPVAPSPSTPPSPEYTVVSGDSFWSIADGVITAHVGHPPSVAETGAYWKRLVAANRDRLVHLGVPDLIFPGQVLVLPEP